MQYLWFHGPFLSFVKKVIAFHIPGILIFLTHNTNAGKLYEDSDCFLECDVASLGE